MIDWWIVFLENCFDFQKVVKRIENINVLPLNEPSDNWKWDFLWGCFSSAKKWFWCFRFKFWLCFILIVYRRSAIATRLAAYEVYTGKTSNTAQRGFQRHERQFRRQQTDSSSSVSTAAWGKVSLRGSRWSIVVHGSRRTWICLAIRRSVSQHWVTFGKQ